MRFILIRKQDDSYSVVDTKAVHPREMCNCSGYMRYQHATEIQRALNESFDRLQALCTAVIEPN